MATTRISHKRRLMDRLRRLFIEVLSRFSFWGAGRIPEYTERVTCGSRSFSNWSEALIDVAIHSDVHELALIQQ
jgi:hypothetical protein